jgi:L-amino acid N-acyltransferase YncA
MDRALLAELRANAVGASLRKFPAVIGDSANSGSIGMHNALDFSHFGVLKSCGWKFERWLVVVMMKKTLGAGDSSAPQ